MVFFIFFRQDVVRKKIIEIIEKTITKIYKKEIILIFEVVNQLFLHL